MLNVNKYLGDALAAGGINLPAAEEPMTKQIIGSYITWEHGDVVQLMASGISFETRYKLTLLIWLATEDTDWQELTTRVGSALEKYNAIQSVQCGVSLVRGAQDVPKLNRKLVQMSVLIADRR